MLIGGEQKRGWFRRPVGLSLFVHFGIYFCEPLLAPHDIAINLIQPSIVRYQCRVHCLEQKDAYSLCLHSSRQIVLHLVNRRDLSTHHNWLKLGAHHIAWGIAPDRHCACQRVLPQ